MGRGPYESSLKRFVECLDILDKDKLYTFKELEDICDQWYNTIRDYMSIRLPEVNVKLRKRGKTVKPKMVTKQVCQTRTYPGLVVDPPTSVNGWLGGLGLLLVVGGATVGLAWLKGRKNLHERGEHGLKLRRVN